MQLSFLKKVMAASLMLIAAFVVTAFNWSEKDDKPTIFIIGDSTVKHGAGNGDGGLWGWGEWMHQYFDTARVQVDNHAIGGRSSRTFITEGRWKRVVDQLEPGDYVLMQFGHNDGGPMATGRARASIKGTGTETRKVIMEKTGEPEVVHTYGWYMRKYVNDTRNEGAHAIVCSPIPRNIFDENGKVARAHNDYGLWAKHAAATTGGFFVDLNERVASKYEEIGEEKVSNDFFLEDHTHTTKEGAILNAETLIEGIAEIEGCDLPKYFSDKAKTIID